jgi:prepilin-type N-terminal cleavage/methylation domain-containing protein
MSGVVIADSGSVMRNERGFTLIELVVVCGAIAVLAAVVVPGMQVVIDRNKVFTTADLLAAQLREARLAAITRNGTFRVMFNCPAAGAMRMVEFMGVPAIDDAPDRCTNDQANDGPVVYIPQGVRFGAGDAIPTLRVNGRGEFSAEGGAMPQTFAVSYGSMSRNVNVTAAGRVRTPAS